MCSWGNKPVLLKARAKLKGITFSLVEAAAVTEDMS